MMARISVQICEREPTQLGVRLLDMDGPCEDDVGTIAADEFYLGYLYSHLRQVDSEPV